MPEPETRPLAIHPWPPTPEQMSLIRHAKAELNLDFLVAPVVATAASPVRVLALGVLPPFVCDAGYVADPTNGLSVLNALRWCLGDEDVERGYSVLSYMQAIFGSETREITNEYDETVEAEDRARLAAWHARIGIGGGRAPQRSVAFR